MNLEQLPYLLAAASSGNLTEAAKQLNITQPALSKYLRGLERETGVKLLERRERKFMLTPAGRRYVLAAQEILDRVNHTRSYAAAMTAGRRERLRIGVSQNRGIAAVAEVYPEFDRRFPGGDLVIREGYSRELRTLLRRGELDGVLGTMRPGQAEEWECVPIFEEEFLLAAPAGEFPERAGERKTAGDLPEPVREDRGNPPGISLETLPFAELADFRDMVFTLPPETSPLYAMIRDIFREEHFEPKVAVTTPNVLIPEAMIRSGGRVGLLPSHHLKEDPDIRFFRILNTRKLTIAYFSRRGREYTEMERYLIWLFWENERRKPGHRMAEGGSLRDIIAEFDPAGVYRAGL